MLRTCPHAPWDRATDEAEKDGKMAADGKTRPKHFSSDHLISFLFDSMNLFFRSRSQLLILLSFFFFLYSFIQLFFAGRRFDGRDFLYDWAYACHTVDRRLVCVSAAGRRQTQDSELPLILYRGIHSSIGPSWIDRRPSLRAPSIDFKKW